MTDIVTQLRMTPVFLSLDSLGQLCPDYELTAGIMNKEVKDVMRKAADEIEQLRKEMGDAVDDRDGVMESVDQLADTCAKLQEERDEARRLLRVMVEYICDGLTNNQTPPHECEFDTDPERGHCKFHEDWVDANTLFRGEDKELQQAIQSHADYVSETTKNSVIIDMQLEINTLKNERDEANANAKLFRDECDILRSEVEALTYRKEMSIHELTKERDEVRRQVCRIIGRKFEQKSPDSPDAVDYARFRGWDCFTYHTKVP